MPRRSRKPSNNLTSARAGTLSAPQRHLPPQPGILFPEPSVLRRKLRRRGHPPSQVWQHAPRSQQLDDPLRRTLHKVPQPPIAGPRKLDVQEPAIRPDLRRSPQRERTRANEPGTPDNAYSTTRPNVPPNLEFTRQHVRFWWPASARAAPSPHGTCGRRGQPLIGYPHKLDHI